MVCSFSHFFGFDFFLLILQRWWWLPTVLGIGLSQVLILTSWQDAQYGTIANMFILIALIAHFGWIL